MHLPFPASLHGFFQGGHGLCVCFLDAVCPDWILGRNPILGEDAVLGKPALHEAAFSVFWPVYSQQYTYSVF